MAQTIPNHGLASDGVHLTTQSPLPGAAEVGQVRIAPGLADARQHVEIGHAGFHHHHVGALGEIERHFAEQVETEEAVAWDAEARAVRARRGAMGGAGGREAMLRSGGPLRRIRADRRRSGGPEEVVRARSRLGLGALFDEQHWSKSSLVRHEAHPMVPVPSREFGRYIQMLSAFDAGYFSIWCRYYVGVTLFLFMMLLPIKMRLGGDGRWRGDPG